jgi:hypothetical protein
MKPADKIQSEIYAKMSFAEKWEEVCKLREAAWKLKAAGLKAQHPDWTEEEIEAEVKKIFLYATT